MLQRARWALVVKAERSIHYVELHWKVVAVNQVLGGSMEVKLHANRSGNHRVTDVKRWWRAI